MEYYYISKEFVSRHFNVPIRYLGDYVIVHRRSNFSSFYGIGLKINSGRPWQRNMFVDLTLHKIAETSVSEKGIDGGFCKIYETSNRPQHLAERFQGDLIRLISKYNEEAKNKDFSYAMIEKEYQKWWLTGKVTAAHALPRDYPLLSPEFFGNIFNVEPRRLELRILNDQETNRLALMYKIRDSNQAIDLAEGRLITCSRQDVKADKSTKQKRKEWFYVRGNRLVPQIKLEHGREKIYLLAEMMSTEAVLPEKRTELSLTMAYSVLEEKYHDLWYHPSMRPLPQCRKYQVS